MYYFPMYLNIGVLIALNGGLVYHYVCLFLLLHQTQVQGNSTKKLMVECHYYVQYNSYLLCYLL